MEITQIKYLLTIVNNEYNLSRSAELLHISQPALSKSVKDMEFKSETRIFKREKGRIVGLTRYGKVLVEESTKVYGQYKKMIEKVKSVSKGNNGTLKIGIAPVIISTVFNEALIDFINKNSGIELKLIEKGAYELQKSLILGEIDLAVIVSPATIEGIYEDEIYKSSVRVWFNDQHRFNNFDKEIPLCEIFKEKIVTLPNSFMVTYQLNKLFRKSRLKPNYFLQTASWDLILNMVDNSKDLIGIIAAPIGSNYRTSHVKSREIRPNFPWNISLCYTMETLDNPVVEYSKKWFLKYFEMYNKISVN